MTSPINIQNSFQVSIRAHDWHRSKISFGKQQSLRKTQINGRKGHHRKKYADRNHLGYLRSGRVIEGFFYYVKLNIMSSRTPKRTTSAHQAFPNWNRGIRTWFQIYVTYSARRPGPLMLPKHIEVVIFAGAQLASNLLDNLHFTCLHHKTTWTEPKECIENAETNIFQDFAALFIHQILNLLVARSVSISSNRTYQSIR